MFHKRNHNTPISDEDSLVGEEQNENKTETNNPFANRHPQSRIPRLYDNPTRYRYTKFCLTLFMILLFIVYIEICYLYSFDFRRIRQQNQPPSNVNFKSLNRKKNSNGMYKDLVDRNDSAPGVRARKERQSISDFRSLNTENRKGILNMYSVTH